MWSILLAMLAATPDAASPIKPNEVVVFFPTFGRLDKASDTWVLPIHGWIYEPEQDSIKRAATLGLFRRALGLDEHEAETAVFKDRTRLFLVDNERGKHVQVRLGDKTYPLGESEANGHLYADLRVPAKDVQRLLQARPQGAEWLSFEAVTRDGDARRFSGSVRLLGETGISVISDIDDTIKATNVADKSAMLANTFLHEFRSVPGMAKVYEAWAKAGASFHYVSASPWQLYAPLSDFLRKEEFPPGTFHMKLFRAMDSSFFNLFADPEQTKLAVIEPMLKAYPRRRFVLVGDAGEKDPEIYGAVARKHPQQILRIFIRITRDKDAGPERFQKAFEGVPADRWRVFGDVRELPVSP